MQLTEGAVMALTAGAMCDNLDVNAVDADGKEYLAAQVCCEDDKQLRAEVNYLEYNPVLELLGTEWCGRHSGFAPTLKYTVQDGSGNRMLMMVSHRNLDIPVRFTKKCGPGTGKLVPGARFKLLDYTTKMTKISNLHQTEEPLISVETLRLAPKSKHQAKLTSFLSKNETKKRKHA